jgi:predicted TIM-barrel fold metal-dependent hydrolase
VCVGYADLRQPDLDDVLDRHQQHSLFRGIRQEAWYDPASRRSDVPRENLLDDPTWVSGLDRVAARDLSFDLLVWSHQLEQAAAIFGYRPELKLVLEHTGVPADPSADARAVWRRGMTTFAERVPNAVLKISALVFISETWALDDLEPIVREAIDIFSPARCMFGSNFPVDRPAVSYPEVWQAYDRFTTHLSEQERALVFRENARRVYRIDIPGLARGLG